LLAAVHKSPLAFTADQARTLDTAPPWLQAGGHEDRIKTLGCTFAVESRVGRNALAAARAQTLLERRSR
jgi:hypothetical protein